MGELIKFAHVNAHGDFIKVLAHFGFTEFTRQGDQLRMLCPLPNHDDTKPSFSVTLTDTGDAKANTWHCFGCNSSGSIIDLAAILGDCDLRSAAKIVAEVSGCSLAPAKAKTGGRQKAQKSPESAADGQDSKSTGSPTENAETGTQGGADAASADEPTVNPPLKFELKGLDPHNPYLRSRVQPGQIADFGLGVLPDSSKSMMAGRLCIPIHNQVGELIAYAGRYLGDAVPDDVEKYKLPPKFQKKQVLFNVHRVFGPDQVQVDDRFVILVEGFFGAMYLHDLGFPTLALMGTSISDAQIALLGDLGVQRVLLLMDGDEPGRNATDALSSLLSRSFFVRSSLLPDGVEPDTASGALLRSIVASCELF